MLQHTQNTSISNYGPGSTGLASTISGLAIPTPKSSMKDIGDGLVALRGQLEEMLKLSQSIAERLDGPQPSAMTGEARKEPVGAIEKVLDNLRSLQELAGAVQWQLVRITERV